MGGKVGFRGKGKTLLDVVNKFCWTKSLLTTPSNVWPPKNIEKISNVQDSFEVMGLNPD